MSFQWTHTVTVLGEGGYSYLTPARLTKAHVIIVGGLRFSRKTGKENGNRRGKPTWRLCPGSLEMVRPKEAKS